MTALSHDVISYKHNYIDQVIARVDFLSPLAGIESNVPQRLSQSILSSFPIAEPKQTAAQEVQIGPNLELASKRVDITEWHFHGRNREKTFVVLPSALFVTHSIYSNYESVRDEFTRLLEVCFDLFKEAQPSRLGLRYINKIHFPDGNPLDWNDYINNMLLSLFSFPEDKRRLSRIFHNLEFAFEEFNLRYQFGMNNPDFPESPSRGV